MFNNHGQNCCAGSRTFVHESIYDEFVKGAVKAAQNRPVGDPFDEGILQGPQVRFDPSCVFGSQLLKFILVWHASGLHVVMAPPNIRMHTFLSYKIICVHTLL